MAAISPDSFDPLRRYVDVRLQMGVPLVDRDWNELADMRRFELRVLLKWLIGDGVPAGSDAFALAGDVGDNNVTIRAGVSPPPGALLAGQPDERRRHIAIALGGGRCLVDGLEAVITEDTDFVKQPLHEDQPDAAKLAARLGVPRIKRMPALDGPAVAYLDVWEHPVAPSDDPDALILPDLGVESCARIRRAWAVRVRPGTACPAPGETPTPAEEGYRYLAGHSYYALATITRRAAGGVVKPDDIHDLRQTGLGLAALERRVRTLERRTLAPAFIEGRPFFPPAGSPGAEILLSGKNFDLEGLVVRFGTYEAEVVGAPSATEIRALVPRMPSGGVPITVSTSGGSVVSDALFEVGLPAPRFADDPFTPGKAPPGTMVRIAGSNFAFGVPSVRFGPIKAELAPRTTYTDTLITVIVPEMPFGDVAVTVENDGGKVQSAKLFTVLPPSPKIDSFTPAEGVPGTIVQITGKNLLSAPLNTPPSVLFGGAEATVLARPAPTATDISVEVPRLIAGPYLITVQTSAGPASSSKKFTVK